MKKVAWVPQDHQLLSGTAGRVALDGYSWLQAVHWVHGAGLYVPQDGPKFGETTVKLAEILATLTPCRPGIAHLMRELKRGERTVQYHLEILRSTGLLAWRSIGTRLPMQEGQIRVESLASEYERLIPLSYDEALGIRTVGEGVERRMTGIAEEGRSVIAALGKKAARKLRRTRRHRSAGQSVEASRCTPMEGGTTHLVSSTSVGNSKTTGGARVEKSITRKKQATTADKNRQRRRTVLGQAVTASMMAAGDKLARAAYRALPWVRSASHDQLRWVLSDLASTGWDQRRSLAWLGEIAASYAGAGLLWRPERPHALIAHALRQESEQQRAADQRACEIDGQTTPNGLFHDVYRQLTTVPEATEEQLPAPADTDSDTVGGEELVLYRKAVWYAWQQFGDTEAFEALTETAGPVEAESILGSALYHHLLSYLSSRRDVQLWSA